MPETPTGYIERPQIKEPLSPLGPEGYQDFSVQRKIVGFFSTNGDTTVLKQSDYEARESERMSFESRLKHASDRPIFISDISHMLKFVPGPLDGENSQENYTSLALKLENDPQTLARISVFLGKDVSHLTPGDIARFLGSNPDVVAANRLALKHIDEVRQLKGSAASLEAEKALKIFLDGVYGDKMVYLKNYELLHEKVFPRKIKRTTRKMQIAKVALAGTTLLGGIHAVNMTGNALGIGHDNSISEYVNAPEQTQNLATPEPSPLTERAIFEKQIEEKYGIELLSQKEGYERIGKTYDESNESLVGDQPIARWRMDQLKTIDELLSYVPPKTIEPRNGYKFAISLWDYPYTGEYGGESHTNYEMISVNQDAYKSGRNKENDFSLLAHELMGHRNDSHELKEKVDGVLSIDMSFLQSTLFEGENKYSTNNPDIPDAVSTLGSFAPDQRDNEGRAGFAQLYVKGYERFMKAVGPVLDGGEFDPNISRDELKAHYPRSQEIYDIYYQLYDGKQYDDIAKKLNPDFKYREKVNIENNPSKEIDDLHSEIWKDYWVYLDGFHEENNPWTLDELNKLKKSLQALPESFYKSVDYVNEDGTEGNRSLVIGIGETTAIENHDHVILSESAMSTNVESFLETGSNLIHRTEGYDKAMKYLLSKDNLHLNETQVNSLLKSLSTLFLKGIDQYAYGSSDVMDSYLHGVSKKDREKIERRIDSFIRDGIFEGRSYVLNDESVSIFQDNQIKTISWDE